jgi:hypothetical protein
MYSEFEFHTEAGATQFMRGAEQDHALLPRLHRDGALYCVNVQDTSETQDAELSNLANKCDPIEVTTP